MASNGRTAPGGRNPYLDDDEEVDDLAFLAHSSRGPPVLGSNGSSANNDYLQKKQLLLEQRQKIQERMLQSSKTSIGLVYESEKMGIATAEELMRQREKLEKVDEHLDGINATMRTTQKHLNTMKSWFGGMFSKSSDSSSNNGSLPASKSTSGISSRQNNRSALGETVDKISADSARRSSDNHPALINRGIDTGGFRFDDDELDQKPTAKGASSGHAIRSQEMDRQLDANLGELGLGLGRLKNLALGLGEEIDQQNELIERVTSKSERSEDTIQYQNRQMRNLLKK